MAASDRGEFWAKFYSSIVIDIIIIAIIIRAARGLRVAPEQWHGRIVVGVDVAATSAPLLNSSLCFNLKYILFANTVGRG